CVQVVVEILLRGGVECGERFQYRSVERPEDVEEMIRRAVAEVEHARLGLDRARLVPEHFLERGARAPECGRFCARRRRQVFSERLEHLPDEALRSPVGEADAASGLADASEFGSRLRLI